MPVKYVIGTQLVKLSWAGIEHRQIEQMFDGVMTTVLYTVASFVSAKKDARPTESNIIFFGKHLELKKNTPYKIVWGKSYLGDNSEPMELYARPYATTPELMWERPKRLPKMTAIDFDWLGGIEISPYQPVPTVSVKSWTNENWVHVNVPYEQTTAIAEAIRGNGFSVHQLPAQCQQGNCFWVVLVVSSGYDEFNVEKLQNAILASAKNGVLMS